MTMREFKLVDENLRGAMRFFGQATGTGEIGAFDGVQLVYSGLDYGVFNIGFLDRRVAPDRDLASILADCSRYYRQRNVRWSFWTCDDLLDPATRRSSREIFAAAGLRPISHAPGMKASSMPPPTRSLPAIECRAVCDAFTRSAFGELTAVCFDIPFAVARAVYEPEQAWKGDYRGFVGLAAGEPVSIVALVRCAGVVGVYSLGTLPDHRRHGYGEALLRAAVAQMLGDAHNEPLVLESTEAGYPLYRRLGFKDVTKFTVYLAK
jgi:GNAT superfamily N-acetyltransferase